MANSFDEIFAGSSHDDFTDEAFRYLSDLEELREKFQVCIAKVAKNEKERENLNELIDKHQFQVKMLRARLEEKEKELQAFKSKLPKINHLNIAEIEAQVRALTSQIKVYIQNYKTTGRFERIDEVINNVRKLFNLSLDELNQLNSENKEVKGILNILISLEVSLFN